MSLYGHKFAPVSEDTISEHDQKLVDMCVESFFLDDLNRMDDKEKRAFMESTEVEALCERAVLKKPTLMRLSKADDEKRRIRIACYNMAKEANDPNWKKAKFHRAKWKEYRAKIFQKYNAKATRIARVAQKQYIKAAQKEKATPAQQAAASAKA